MVLHGFSRSLRFQKSEEPRTAPESDVQGGMVYKKLCYKELRLSFGVNLKELIRLKAKL